jgi:hypothetical protein
LFLSGTVCNSKKREQPKQQKKKKTPSKTTKKTKQNQKKSEEKQGNKEDSMATGGDITLRDVSHPSLNEALKAHNSVTFKLVRTGEYGEHPVLATNCTTVHVLLHTA